MSEEHESQQFVSMANERRYFGMIPHIADDDLSLHEYRLYGHYVKVCGMCSGICEESVRELADKLGMGKTKLIETRDSLLQKGFIRYKRVGHADAEVGKGETYAIAIADKWLENMQRYHVPDEGSVPIQERSPKVTVPNEERTVPNQERTVPNGEQKDQEGKKEEVAPPVQSGGQPIPSTAGTSRFRGKVDPPTANGSKPQLNEQLLANHLSAVTGKSLNKDQRARLAKPVVVVADGMKREYRSPEVMYTDENGFSQFVEHRLSVYKQKGETDLKIIIGDICNYERGGEKGNPGWLAWKKTRPEFNAPPAGSVTPLHEKKQHENLPQVIEVNTEPARTMFHDDDDIPEAVIGAK